MILRAGLMSLIVWGAGQAHAFSMGNHDVTQFIDKHAKWTGLSAMGGRLSGHDEISRQALALADVYIKDSFVQEMDEFVYSPDEYRLRSSTTDVKLGLDIVADNLKQEVRALVVNSAVKDGLIGLNSPSMLVRGNFATDFPVAPKGVPEYPIDISGYWNLSFDEKDVYRKDYHTHSLTQTVHGLRNREPFVKGDKATVMSNRMACVSTREAIQRITKDAMNEWYQGMIAPLPQNLVKLDAATITAYRKSRLRKAAFLMGHATHAIQDTFSPAHTVRKSRDENADIVDFCTYGENLKPICYHKTVDERDTVWILTDATYQQSVDNWSEEGDMPTTKCQTIVKSVQDSLEAWLGEKTANSEGLKHSIWARIEARAVQLMSSLVNKNRDSLEKLFEIVNLNEIDPQEKATCLKHEARLAKYATAKYIALLYHYMHEMTLKALGKPIAIDTQTWEIRVPYQRLTKDEEKVKHPDPKFRELEHRMMTKFFEGPSGFKLDAVMPEGILRCEQLPL